MKASEMIYFNKPAITGEELYYLEQVLHQTKLSGDGPFTQQCSEWLETALNAQKAILTTSCTHALEMTAILSNITEGDEIIMPSYTFVSTANAFVLRGAKIVFVDIRPDTMNIDERLIEGAITPKTKAIVVVHYAGVSCEMDRIIDIAEKHHLVVIEDAAQGILSKYKGKYLGTMGDLGCYSFHETKNLHCGEGGAILINDERYTERAEIIREKGTNRSRFFRGQVDKYTWVDMGSSYLPSEISAAFLRVQFNHAERITRYRLMSWNRYYERLSDLKQKGYIELPAIPEDCTHNAHMFYIKCKSLDERSRLIKYLMELKIQTVFHYVPLHSSPAGSAYGRFHAEDVYTTKESNRILRLPMYYQLTETDIDKVTESIRKFYI